MNRRNDVHLAVKIDGNWVITHFNLKEFENKHGWVMIHKSVIVSLEKLREELAKVFNEEIEIIITNSTRTHEDLNSLAKKLGWTDKGGLVSRNSRHLECYGGIAVDFYVRYKQSKKRIPSPQIGSICRKYFDFVKADYADCHIHADNRTQINKLKEEE
ncbi:MAG TPA: hypothetical protein PLX23_05130 [Candidatus Hydrogenedens sp.]|nr:hypothetical protein [Candidatus Hydrogenedens sp.]